MTEKVDKAWLDVARDVGRQDREGELYLLRTEIERLRAVLLYITELDDDGEAPVLARRALEHKP